MIKRKPRPEKAAGPFVLSATSLCGIDLSKGLLRSSRGTYISVVKVRGMDISGMRPDDQEFIYAGWGACEQACETPRKIILCETRPELSSQKKHIEQAMIRQKNPFLQTLLERQRFWIDHYQQNQRDQAGYILFFSKTPDEAEETRNRYIQRAIESRINVTACTQLNDLLELCQILLSNPEWR